MLTSLIIGLVIIGVLLWGIGQLPIDPTFYTIIRVVLIIVGVVIAIKLIMALLGHNALL